MKVATLILMPFFFPKEVDLEVDAFIVRILWRKPAMYDSSVCQRRARGMEMICISILSGYNLAMVPITQRRVTEAASYMFHPTSSVTVSAKRYRKHRHENNAME